MNIYEFHAATNATANQIAHAAPAALAADDPAVALKKLSALHDEGLLTDDEFEAKRAEVITRL